MKVTRRTLVALSVAVAAAAMAAPATAQVYTMASNPQGSLYFSASAAIARVAADKLKMQIRVQPTAGSSTYIPLLNSGEVDFAFTNGPDTLDALKGTGLFDAKKSPNLRAISAVFPLLISFVVAADSPVKSVKDLKGLRLPANYVGQTIGKQIQDALLATGGLALADVKTVPVVNMFQGVELLGKGGLDAAPITPGVAQVQQANVDLAARGGVRFLPIDPSPDSVAKARKHLLVRPMKLDPAPHLVGVVEPMSFMAFHIYLMTNDKMSNEVVYRLAKLLHQSYDDLVKITPVLARFDPKQMTDQLEAPWHPGAIKFYGEIGQWPPKG
jgi:TRAP transporter TAXI family solute receptor